MTSWYVQLWEQQPSCRGQLSEAIGPNAGANTGERHEGYNTLCKALDSTPSMGTGDAMSDAKVAFTSSNWPDLHVQPLHSSRRPI